MSHSSTYEYYYRGMSPGSSHEDAYHMQDQHTEAPATCTSPETCAWAICPAHQHLLDGVKGHYNPSNHEWVFPPGSKEEHDLVGCASLYNERCPHCHPLTLDELPAIVVGTAFDVLLTQLDEAFGRASIWFSDAQQKIAAVRHSISDDEIPF